MNWWSKINSFCVKNASVITAIGVLFAIATFVYGFWSHGQIVFLNRSANTLNGNYNTLLQSSTFIQQEINSSTVVDIIKSNVTAPVNSPNSQNIVAPNNTGVIAPNNDGQINQNQVATYTWSNSNTWQNTWDYSWDGGANDNDIVLSFAANSPILPNGVCVEIETDVQVKRMQGFGLATNVSTTYNNQENNSSLFMSMFCFSNLNSPENIIVTFDNDTIPTIVQATMLNN